ncbi:MAG TPA: hypothetical protein VK828_06905 [Terriglobales bacterium]|jgi:hypothetical protein|nr:hypothetical protein [Terriglobales bacterium]
MELLDRYLHAIEFWLPKRQRQDIIAELSEDLRSQIEEKEAELGRKLQNEEVEAILKRCGSPLAVALRYQPQQYLIGPTLFPVYRFVLALLMAGCVVPQFLIWLGFLIVDPAHRGGYLHIGNLGITVVFFAFFTTLGFAILERSGAMQERLNTWDPRKLPPLKDPNRIARSGPLGEIAVAVIFNAWFVGMFWPRPAFDLFGAQISPAPVWKIIFWSFLVLAVANVALAGVNLFRPYWTRLRASLRLVFDGVGGALFCWLLKAQVLAGISVPGPPAPKSVELTRLINVWLTKALPWAAVTILAILAFDAYRIMRVRSGRPRGGSMEAAVQDLSNLMVNGH